MSCFEALTQYNIKYKYLSTFGETRSACHIFSLITAEQFMENGSVNRDSYIRNLDTAVLNFVTMNIDPFLSFSEALKLTTLSNNDISCTTSFLINEFGYSNILRDENYNKSYSIIFLKNGNFFTLLYDPIKKYCIRDCHMDTQYNFNNLQLLILHINTIYHFNKEIDLDGYKIPEYSSIEYIIIDNNFQVNLLMAPSKCYVIDNNDKSVQNLDNNDKSVPNLDNEIEIYKKNIENSENDIDSMDIDEDIIITIPSTDNSFVTDEELAHSLAENQYINNTTLDKTNKVTYDLDKVQDDSDLDLAIAMSLQINR